MNVYERRLVEEIHRAAIASLPANPLPERVPVTLDPSELPEAEEGSALWQEWNTYRREVHRLLAEGHDGKWLLLKGDQILGIHDTLDAADAAGLQMVLAGTISAPFALRQVLSKEPLLRVRGNNWPLPCRVLLTQQAKPA